MSTLSLNQSKLMLNAVDQLFRFDDTDILDRVIIAARKIVGCEFASLLRVDAESSVHALRVDPVEASTFSDNDTESRLISTHPLWADFARGDLTIPKKVSDKVSLAQFENTPIYCESYRAAKIRDQMVVLIEQSRTGGIVLTLHRIQRCFNEDNMKLFSVLVPFLRHAHNHAEVLKRIGGLTGMIEYIVQVEDKPIVYFTIGLNNLVVSGCACRLLRKYFATWSELTEPLPDDVVRWVNQEESKAKAVDNISPPSGPLRITAESSELIITLLAEREKRLLIMEEQFAPMSSRMLMVLGLTRRETDVLFWVTEGKTNAEIGILCGISPRTVQKHIEHVYQKLGVETRTAAVKSAIEAVQKVNYHLKLDSYKKY